MTHKWTARDQRPSKSNDYTMASEVENGHTTNDGDIPITEAEKQGSATDVMNTALTVEGGENGETVTYEYLHGMPFVLITVSLAVMVFMVNLETSVVTTSLVTISNDLGGFDNSSWLISGYLLGYVAVIVIFAKLSDIFGRKPVYLLSMTVFVIFSAACSAAQTMTQLIVFRTLQGLGGGGCYSLSTIIIIELVPPQQHTKYVTQLSVVTTMGLMLGPIVGGVICSHTTWRWVFIINVPITAVAFGFGFAGFPRYFPFQGLREHKLSSLKKMLARSTRDRLDLPGAVLMLFGAVLLTAGFEEAGSSFPWKSAYVICLIVISGTIWATLLLWERRITLQESLQEPVLPWRFFTNRVMVGVLLSFALVGGPVVVSILQIPQRFQLVYGLSAWDAGIRLIPFTICMPFGAAISSVFTTRLHVAAIWVILGGACLQTLGFALLGTLPDSLVIPSRIYGFEIIAGASCGCNYTLLFLIVPRALELRDHAVGMGSASQFRQIGGSIGIAIVTAVFNSYISSPLSSLLGTSDFNAVESLDQYLGNLPAKTRDEARLVLAQGYNRQMLVLCGLAAAQIPAAFLLWKRSQIKV